MIRFKNKNKFISFFLSFQIELSYKEKKKNFFTQEYRERYRLTSRPVNLVLQLLFQVFPLMKALWLIPAKDG